jgi:hypothetical protein
MTAGHSCPYRHQVRGVLRLRERGKAGAALVVAHIAGLGNITSERKDNQQKSWVMSSRFVKYD